MFEEGKRQGVRHMVATHGMASPTALTIEQAKQAAQLGVFVEFCGGTLEPSGSQARIDRFAEQIRQLGVEHVILSSDLGEVGKPLPVPGYATYLEAMRKKGFTDQELDRMTKENPAKLLGLQ
jgi:predicted metal-dependent phosphotriesterase family hydrolase